MKIYVLGNPSVATDALPVKLLGRLKRNFPQITFRWVDPNENFPPKAERNLVIIDTVKGITSPRLIELNDLAEWNKAPVSPHDYDLLMHLLLLQKTKRIDSARIVGVPFGSGREVSAQLIKVIASLNDAT